MRRALASFLRSVLRPDVLKAKLLLLQRTSSASISVGAPAGVTDSLHYFPPAFPPPLLVLLSVL